MTNEEQTSAERLCNEFKTKKPKLFLAVVEEFPSASHTELSAILNYASPDKNHPALYDAIVSAFPNLKPHILPHDHPAYPKYLISMAKMNQVSDRLWQRYESGKSLQSIERRDFSAARDLDRLRRAVSSLVLAAGHLKKVGLSGGRAVRPVVGNFLNEDFRSPQTTEPASIDAPQVLANWVEKLSDELSSATEAIDPNAQTFAVKFSCEDSKTNESSNARKKTAAQLLAVECAQIYKQFAGKAPTVNTDWNENTAYGEFLEFVENVFAAVDLSASAEHFARSACRAN